MACRAHSSFRPNRRESCTRSSSGAACVERQELAGRHGDQQKVGMVEIAEDVQFLAGLAPPPRTANANCHGVSEVSASSMRRSSGTSRYPSPT